MNNKKTTSKKVTKNVTKRAKLQTINGIQTLPSGSYRVRKSINNKTFDCTFSKMSDARAYRDMLNSK